MKKRLIVLILAAVFVLVCLSACGSGSSDRKQNKEETAQTETVQMETEQTEAAEPGTEAPEQMDADTSNVSVDYGTSDQYSREELEEAVNLIKNDFSSWRGCTLNSLRYAGDADSKDGLTWLNALGKGTEYEEAAEFLGDFHSPVNGGMWEPDKEYRNYQWWLARTTGGNWDLVLYNEDADSSGPSGSTAGKTEPATEEKEDSSLMKDGLSVSPMNATMVCNAEDGVNVRAGCSKDDTILGFLSEGNQVQVTGTVTKDGADYGWYQIEYNGQTAYVIAEFFQ